MAAFDFSSSFSGINSALQSIGKQNERAYQMKALGEVGKDIEGGNYDVAARKLAGLGDIGSAAKMLELGQAAKAKAAQAEASRGFNAMLMGGNPASSAPIAGPASLIQNESGGNWQAQNAAVGAGGKVGHFGRLQFGQARLQEAQAAGAIPAGTTPQAFMASPELQQRAERWHFADIDQSIQQNGFDKLVGQSINGVPVTIDGMRAVAHLGGKQGLERFIRSGGRYNPQDENGTRLSDYFARHGGGGSQVAQGAPAAAPAQPVQVAETEEDVQRLEAAQAAGQPVQVAQAPAQPGTPVADAPAPGAAPAQGFAIPNQDASPLPGDPVPQLTTRQLIGAATNPNLPKEQRDFAKTIFEQRIAAARADSAPTDAVRNYRFYRQQEMAAGREPMSFQDFRKSTAPQTNVNMPPAEKEYDKQAAKDYAEMNRDLIKGAQAANQKIATLNRLGSLLTNPNIRTGAGAQLALQAARLGKSVFGIETEGLGPAEAINAIANQFALELRNPSGGAGMPGALSDKDREFLMQSTPGLERDPEGNRLIIDYMRRLNQRSVDVERLRREYVKGNKGRLDDGFFEKLAEFSEKNPLFPEAAPEANAPAAATAAPKRGDVVEGYRFKGGDPSKPESWHKVR